MLFRSYLPELWRDDLDVRPPWLLSDWTALAKLIVENTGCGIAVVGADWAEDREYAALFVDQWTREGGDPALVVNKCGGTHVAEAYRIAMRGKCLFSYQSGIGIGSVYLNVPTACFWRAKGDSTEAPPGGREDNPGLQYVSFDEGMASAWAPPGSLASRRYMPLIYGRQTPATMFADAVSRNWFSR